MISTIFLFAFAVCFFSVDAGVLTVRTWNTNTQCQTAPDLSTSASLPLCVALPAGSQVNGSLSTFSNCNEVDNTLIQGFCSDANCQSCTTQTVQLDLIACQCVGSVCVSTTCGARAAIAPRNIIAAQVGNWSYLVSAKFSSLAGLGSLNVVGDVIVAALGTVFGTPVKVLAYVSGNVAADTYLGNAARVQVDAAAGTLIEVFRYMGEYCETNGEPGYQPNQDRLIQVFPAILGAPWSLTSGTYVNSIGKTVYWASLVSSLNNFNHTCYVFPTPTIIAGRTVSQYSTKCDLIIDYTLLWSNVPLAVANCPDNKRFMGIAVDFAAAAFDIDIEAKASFVSAAESKITFGNGKITAAWDNYVYAGASLSSIVMSKKLAIAATFIENVASIDQVGVNASLAFGVKRLYFTFGSKADGNTFYWDPTTEVSDPLVCQTCYTSAPKEDLDWIAAVVIAPLLLLAIIGGVAFYFLKYKKDTEHA